MFERSAWQHVLTLRDDKSTANISLVKCCPVPGRSLLATVSVEGDVAVWSIDTRSLVYTYVRIRCIGMLGETC